MFHKNLFLTMAIMFSPLTLVSCQNKVDTSAKATEPSPLQASSATLPVIKTPASYVRYDTVEEIEAKADLVIIGRPMSSLSDSRPISVLLSEQTTRIPAINESISIREENGAIIDRYSVVPIKVNRVLKGEIEEREIKVLQAPVIVGAYGVESEYISLMEGSTPLKKNAKYILFLRKSTLPNLKGFYDIVGVMQGKYNVSKDDGEEAEEEAKDPRRRELRNQVRRRHGAAIDETP